MAERVGWVREAAVLCLAGLDLYIHFGRVTLTDDVEGTVLQSGPTVGVRKPQLPRPSTTQARRTDLYSMNKMLPEGLHLAAT
jgi:hypothetical protein